MPLHPFVDPAGRLRSGWWIAAFLALLAALLLPLLLLTRRRGGEVSLLEQAALVLVASLACQALRRRPVSDLLGPLDRSWPRQWLLGVGSGSLLMAVPALALGLAGVASWRINAGGATTFWSTLAVLAAAAAAEELLFRGFLFQRLLDGLGEWPAQFLIGALFLLTHSDALRDLGALGYLAAANIFLASLVFGLAYLRTGSLAIPLGLHLAANVMQGPVLGFGVSGDLQPGLLVLALDRAPAWLHGGRFGLEASLPGLLGVAALVVVLLRWRPRAGETRRGANSGGASPRP